MDHCKNLELIEDLKLAVRTKDRALANTHKALRQERSKNMKSIVISFVAGFALALLLLG